MPIVKAVIEGREYSFAPLKIKELRKLNQESSSGKNLFELTDLWMPLVKASVERAGGSDVPDVDDMDATKADTVLAQLMAQVMRASRVEHGKPGEEQPTTAAIGTASSAL